MHQGGGRTGGEILELLRSVGVIGVVVAFFSTSMFAFANADHLLACGFAVSIGITCAIWFSRLEAKWAGIAMFVCAMAPLVGIAVVTSAASANYALNQQRCLNIEVDMLSQKPVRPNGPEIFQALRCVPQADASNAILLLKSAEAKNAKFVKRSKK